jgi:hypothetical protein
MYYPKETRVQPINNNSKTHQFQSRHEFNNRIKQVLLRLIVLNNLISDDTGMKKQKGQKEDISLVQF